jgi:hypothetical protein
MAVIFSGIDDSDAGNKARGGLVNVFGLLLVSEMVHGIALGGAIGRCEARCQGHQQQEGRDADQRERVGWPHTIEQGCDEAHEIDRDDEARDHSACSQGEAALQNEPENISALRSDGQSQGDLQASLLDESNLRINMNPFLAYADMTDDETISAPDE